MDRTRSKTPGSKMKLKKVGRFFERVATAMGIETQMKQKKRYEKLWKNNPEIRHLVPKRRCPQCNHRLDGKEDSASDTEVFGVFGNSTAAAAKLAKEAKEKTPGNDLMEQEQEMAMVIQEPLLASEVPGGSRGPPSEGSEGADDSLLSTEPDQDHDHEANKSSGDVDVDIHIHNDIDIDMDVDVDLVALQELRVAQVTLNAASLIDHEEIDFDYNVNAAGTGKPPTGSQDGGEN